MQREPGQLPRHWTKMLLLIQFPSLREKALQGDLSIDQHSLREQWPGRSLLGAWTGWADTLSSTLFSQICQLLKGTSKGLRPNLRGFRCLLSWLHPLSQTSFLFIYLFIYLLEKDIFFNLKTTLHFYSRVQPPVKHDSCGAFKGSLSKRNRSENRFSPLNYHHQRSFSQPRGRFIHKSNCCFP